MNYSASPVMRRISYHTNIKVLTREDILPDKYKKQISRSLLWKWKQEPEDKYLGNDLNCLVRKHSELIRQFAHDSKARKLYAAYLRLVVVMKGIIRSATLFRKTIYKSRERIVDVVQQVGKVISVKTAVKVFGISRSTFQSWLVETKAKCFESYFHACNRYYPGQLMKKEVQTIKNLLTDVRFLHWPVVSVAYYALREGLLYAAPQTWYKYAKLLNLKRPVIKKKPKKIGIKAFAPNQIWHADVTIFKTLDNVRHYLYLVVDNFSRCILSWRLSEMLTSKIRVETLKEAGKNITREMNIDLVVDGGSENNNKSIDEFIEDTGNLIKKLVAQKDIHFSNSMVEATNRLLKYSYLYRKPIENGHTLQKYLEEVIPEYNMERPHYALYGLTPCEAYSGKLPDKGRFHEKLMKAKQDRIRFNQRNTCKQCAEL